MIVHRKLIIDDRIECICKEYYNLDQSEVIGLDKMDYVEYLKGYEIVNDKEFPG